MRIIAFLSLFAFGGVAQAAGPVARLAARYADGGIHLYATVHDYDRAMNGFLRCGTDLPAWVEFLDVSGKVFRRIPLGTDMTAPFDAASLLSRRIGVSGVGRHIFVGPERPTDGAEYLPHLPANLPTGDFRLRMAYTRRLFMAPAGKRAIDQEELSRHWRHPTAGETALVSNDVAVSVPRQLKRRAVDVLTGLEEPPPLGDCPSQLHVSLRFAQPENPRPHSVDMLHMDSGSQCEVMIENLSSESMQINKPDLSSIDVAKLLIGPIGGEPIGDLLAYDYEGGVFGGGDAEMTLPPGGILILTEPIFPLSNGVLDNHGRRVAIDPGRYAIVVEILDGLTASKGTLPTGRVLGKSDSIPITLIEGTQAGNNP